MTEAEGLFRLLAARRTLDERVAYVQQHPVIISRGCLELAFSVPQLKPLFIEFLPRFGFRLSVTQAGTEMWSNPDRYPVGGGPIETLWQELEDGEVTDERAIELVAERRIASALMFTYFKAVADRAYEAMRRGDRRLATRRFRIIVEATSQVSSESTILDDAEIWQIRKLGGVSWIEIASSALVDVPDGRVFHHALQCGTLLAEEAKQRGQTDDHGNLLERLGVLYLDMYSIKLRLNNFEFDEFSWKHRLIEEFGKDEAAAIEKKWPLPSAKDALARADELLTEAITLRDMDERAVARTALVQCLYYRHYLHEPVTVERIREQAKIALAELERADFPEKTAKVRAMLALLDKDPSQAAPREQGTPRHLDEILNRSYESLIEEMGKTQLLALTRYNVVMVEDSDPAAALALLEKTAPLWRADVSTDETARTQLLELQQRLLVKYLRERDSSSRYRPAAGLPATLSEREIQAADFLERAMLSGVNDQEIAGLRDLDKAIELLPVLDTHFSACIDWLRTRLYADAGSSAFKVRNAAEAAAHYAAALPSALRLQLTEAVAVVLARLDNLVKDHGAAGSQPTLLALRAVANSAEALLGDAGTASLQSIYTNLMAQWSWRRRLKPEIESGALFLLMRLAKGRRFASTVAGPPSYEWKRDAEALRRLSKIEEARVSLTSDGSPERGDSDDLETLLMGPIGSRDHRPGMTDRQRFENQRYSFDRYFNRRVLGSTLREIPPGSRIDDVDIDRPELRFALADVQARLDAETVLLDCLVTSFGPTQQTLFVLALTHDLVAFDVSVLTTSGPADQEPDPRAPTALGELVSKTRREIQTAPVKGASRSFPLRPLFSSIVDFLDDQRLHHGKRHLCIVPHRELHYLPIHLFGDGERALGDDWVVTYLPNLQLLFRSAATRAPDRSMVAIGVEFEHDNPFGLAPTVIARASATGVAELFDERPLVGGDATEVEMMAALEHTRFAYIYTHGLQCVYAPAFHRLLCAADGAGESAIDAYEISGRPLSQLEILGTAACETALGRFDAGDNLTGLPGSFFQAGVRSMVGTLWNVHVDTADHFFLTLFTGLANGLPRREAFAAAQRDTRTAFPLPVDWGAFYFMGA